MLLSLDILHVISGIADDLTALWNGSGLFALPQSMDKLKFGSLLDWLTELNVPPLHRWRGTDMLRQSQVALR